MPQAPASIKHKQEKQKLGDRVRSIADRLKHETDVQIKVTSRILGAAAQIAENHDQLINQVVDMVEEDLNQQTQAEQKNVYTVDLIKQKFKTLREAKAHFGIKANSWAELIYKLNSFSAPSSLPVEISPTSVPERLNVIENEMKLMRTDISQLLYLMQQLLDKE